MGRKKGGGGKLNRSEILQARLNPKLRLGAEILARIQRRTISSLIEILVEDAMKQQKIASYQTLQSPDIGTPPEDATLDDLINYLWSFEEADRFAKFAFYLPGLMSPDEVRVWHHIHLHPYFWVHYLVKTINQSGKVLPEKSLSHGHDPQSLIYERLREQWPLIKSILEGKTDIDALKNLKPPSEKIVTMPYTPSPGFEVVKVRYD